MTPHFSIGIIGAGRVGGSLARALAGADWPLAGVASRSRAAAEQLAAETGAPVMSAGELLALADLAVLAVPDDALAGLAADLAAGLPAAPRAAVHCSGALSLEPLAPLAERGWLVGGFHPLQSFPTAETPVQPGITWGIEAAPPLREQLIGLAAALGGAPLLLRPGDKTLYHAAAVVACNYALTLAQAAVDLLGLCEIPPAEALAALLPLLRGNLAALELIGLPGALTGPLARGDAGTVARHLTDLDRRAPAIAALYRTLGRATLPMAGARGLDPARLQVLATLLAQEAPDASVDQ
ncbi:MAG TPA: Rossmann-like and DUF2520 domain-containing protein [Herpetosiphonaceae bacterium]